MTPKTEGFLWGFFVGCAFIAISIPLIRYESRNMHTIEGDNTPIITASETPDISDSQYNSLTRDNCTIVLNNTRLRAGLKQLASDPILGSFAQEHADAIANGKTSYSHDKFEAWTVIGAFRNYVQVGESIANADTCPADIKGLTNDPSHGDALLNPKARSIGVGVSGKNLVIIESFSEKVTQ